MFSTKLNKNKIIKILNNLYKEYDKIILSDKLVNLYKDFNDEIIKRCIYNTLNDKAIYKLKILETLKNIVTLTGKSFNNISIYILMNHFDSNYNYLLTSLANETRSLNIISLHMREFKTIEHNIYRLLEIPIVISNNKRKSLTRANYIINFDFDEKLLNEFNINRNAIILNISKNELKKINLFNGIIINNVITQKSGYTLYFENKFNNIYNVNTLKNVSIKGFLGNNGTISNNELTMK